MKIERTKNAARNIFFGTILKIYQILLPFVFRTLIIHTIGIQYLGLNSLFTSILQVLNLAELGVGGAMVFSMYKPIAEDDEITICALMKLYKIYYRVIGSVILVVGIIITPGLPYLVNSQLPEGVNLYVLYYLNLAATVLTYWLFAYKNSILSAHQRTDIGSKIGIIMDTGKYSLQFIGLAVFKNYYYYLIAGLFIQVISNITTAIVANQMYPQYKPFGNLPKEEVKKINQRVKDLFTSKLGGTIVNSADTIVISAFLGLEVLAIYQNYYYIMSSVMAFLTIIYSSLTAGLGNGLITKSNDENYKDFKTLTFIIFWIFGFCTSAFLCLYQPFMSLWMGDNYLLSIKIVVLLCIYFLGYEVVMFLSLYKDAGGIWHNDRFRPLISGLVNLGLNLCLVQFIGLYGIVLSTIISVYFVSAPWIIQNVMSLIFHRKQKDYYRQILQYLVVIVVATVICGGVCSQFNFRPFVTCVVRTVICCLIPNVIFFVAYRRTEEFKRSCQIVYRIVPGKFRHYK